ncbi:MAG: amino acid adenylation domain-containing protein, partial [Gemmatimonadetes bacterium]|nr:amino acid adenylation domain-containing protein [Gemmatimonadota bacterium]
MVGHLLRLLEGVLHAPDAPLSRIALLGSGEREQVVERWNATAREYPRTTVHELFAAQAARTPEAVALAYEGGRLTYRELEARADRLAHLLRERGVGPETRVGVCMERGPELVVALLGVLKAGGAYVPLDPGYPEERLAYMLADSAVAVILAQGHLRAKVAGHAAEVIAPLPRPLPHEGGGEHYGASVSDAFPQNWGKVASLSEPDGGVLSPGIAGPHPGASRHPSPNSGRGENYSDDAVQAPPLLAGEGLGRGLSGPTPENLAYVIYTSGSTGRPKGAMNEHGGVVNRLLWMQEEYGLTPGDVVLQKTPFSFDVSVWEFFWPLLTGARLVLAKPEGHRDPAYLREVIEAEGVTTLHFVPSMLRAFLEEPGVERCASVHRVVCSGEALPFELQERFFARLPGAELHNLYGPTEAAVDVTFQRCAPGEPVTIGLPVANTQVHLLDRALEPAPVGVPGELHIGGVQVGRGYLGRPELTAEKFVPDPFGREPGARLYRTGDRARRRADGRIEYLGRIDQQVKVRGFRIEPGEIEAALESHPRVRQAAVVVREDTPGDPRLVAYLVVEGEVPAAGELRAHLGTRLPEHMVPSAFVALESLPLTPSGKLDRRALPAPEGASGGEYEAPRSETERVLAEGWAEVLGVERVGVHDSFFDLGGHSLLGTRVISRVREAFGVELPLRALFEAPTVAGLAERVEEALRPEEDDEPAPGEHASLSARELLLRKRRAERRRAEPAIVRRTGDGPAPLSFAQQRLWLVDQLEPGNPAYHMPSPLRVRGALDVEALEHALAEIVRRHESLRTRIVTHGDEPGQVVDPMCPVRLPT